MAVVVLVEGVGADRCTVAVAPLAELAACLHVLTHHDHHPEHAAWVRRLLGDAPAELHAGLRRFAPLWTALRWRGFYPGLDAAGTDRAIEVTAHACVSGYHGFDFGRLRHDPAQAGLLRRTAARLPEPHLRLAEDLLADPDRLHADIAAFVGLARRVFFDELWAGVEPVLTRAAVRLRRRLADAGAAEALVSLDPSSARLVTAATGPARVVFDKVHHAVLSPARTGLLLVPTRYGAPHLLVKNEPGLQPVVHFPVDPPDVGVTLVRNRLLALTDPHRVRLCRLIARQSMTPADLADRLAMTRPQVSRHLRVLRELGLVRVERNARQVYYRLDLGAVSRIGGDLATALQH
ncbi:DUF5937 family protein [Dactylosporangium sp. NPDC005572]|uniref:ArsR/SmtB family transcription factor n=1 Tax=Dactylosporangium sp. NPDC005572 TaxID=3156889 RepID=UPI0033BF6C00